MMLQNGKFPVSLSRSQNMQCYTSRFMKLMLMKCAMTFLVFVCYICETTLLEVKANVKGESLFANVRHILANA